MAVRYLSTSEYRLFIEPEHLLGILNGDETILADVEELAFNEVNKYLARRYDLTAAVYPIVQWDAGTGYDKDTVVECLPPEFEEGQVVEKGTIVGYKSITYQALAPQDEDASLNPEDAPHLWRSRGTRSLFKATDDTSAGQSPLMDTIWQPVIDRNTSVLKYVADIALYHLYTRTGVMPDTRLKPYNDAVSNLIKAAQGHVDLNLPLKTEDQRPLGTIRTNSRIPHRGWGY